MTSKTILVIGISGTTNSGKTTLTSMLKSALPQAHTICQDDYFYEPGDPRVPQGCNGFENWDCLQALDMEKMVADIKSWVKLQKTDRCTAVLIIEGFLIFNHKYLAQLCDKKYFIRIDQTTSAQRRIKRTYNPPDTPGYFEEVVWPQYLKNLEDIQDQHDIKYLDGSKTLDALLTQVLTDFKDTMLGDVIDSI